MKLETCGLRLAASCASLGLCLSLCLSACSQVRQISPADTFSAEDKLNYLVLAAIAPDAARQYVSARSAQSRADYLDWFWKNPSALAGTHLSSLLPSPSAFFRERALEARTYFGTTDLLNDDRVL